MTADINTAYLHLYPHYQHPQTKQNNICIYAYCMSWPSLWDMTLDIPFDTFVRRSGFIFRGTIVAWTSIWTHWSWRGAHFWEFFETWGHPHATKSPATALKPKQETNNGDFDGTKPRKGSPFWGIFWKVLCFCRPFRWTCTRIWF